MWSMGMVPIARHAEYDVFQVKHTMSTSRNDLKRKASPTGLSDAPVAQRSRRDSECESEDDFTFEAEEQEPEQPELTASRREWLEWWARMEKLFESGRARAIGVSNFSVKK